MQESMQERSWNELDYIFYKLDSLELDKKYGKDSRNWKINYASVKTQGI